jgi:hypothetical protein
LLTALGRVIISESALEFAAGLEEPERAVSKVPLDLWDMCGVSSAEHQNIPAFGEGVAEVIH